MQLSTQSLAVLMLGLFVSSTAQAIPLYPWTDHARPFDFVFDNEIDSHQQTRQTRGEALSGFFYIRFTGAVTSDGYRVATHADCNADDLCTVGWLLRGRRAEATLLSMEQGDHPLFSIERSAIPQPGGYVHFHWLGELPMVGESAQGYVLELIAVDRFCFVHDSAAAMRGASCVAQGGLVVTPGLDVATHLNIIATP